MKGVKDEREGRAGREEGNRNLEFRTKTRVGKVRHPTSVMLSFEGPKNVVHLRCHFSSRSILDQTSELITRQSCPPCLFGWFQRGTMHESLHHRLSCTPRNALQLNGSSFFCRTQKQLDDLVISLVCSLDPTSKDNQVSHRRNRERYIKKGWGQISLGAERIVLESFRRPHPNPELEVSFDHKQTRHNRLFEISTL